MKNFSFPQNDSIQVGFDFSESFQEGLESKLCPCKYYKVHLEKKLCGGWNSEALYASKKQSPR